jgi:hypothetical protein
MVDVRGNSSFAFSTTEHLDKPYEIVEEAVTQCFQLFEIPSNEYKKFVSKDGEVEFRNKSKILNISYKEISKGKNLRAVLEKVEDENKAYAYEVDWVIFNVTWDKWSEKLRKIYNFILSQGTGRIPLLGGLLSDFLQKKVKNTGDKWIVKDINSEFDEIFFTILKSDPNIEYVKYQNKKLIKSDNIEQKSTHS